MANNCETMMPYKSFSTMMGTFGGTFLATLPVLGSEDVIRTALLALIGAVVSFSVSFSLKIVVRNVFSAKLKSNVRLRRRKGKSSDGEVE